MRIISGLNRGKKLIMPNDKTTRPLKDLAKESIFNILTHANYINFHLKDSKVLDLFSGIGSFGLECISRGAFKITFVEKDKSVLKILQKNLVNLSIIDKANVNMDEIMNFLNKNKKEKFDIIFFDPPFSQNTFIDELKFIYDSKMYSKNHVIIIHRERKSEDKLDKILNLNLVRNYGRSKIIFGSFYNKFLFVFIFISSTAG